MMAVQPRLSLDEVSLSKSYRDDIDAFFKLCNREEDLDSREFTMHIDNMNSIVRDTRESIRRSSYSYMFWTHDIFVVFSKYSKQMFGDNRNDYNVINGAKMFRVFVGLSDRSSEFCKFFGERGCLHLLLPALESNDYCVTLYTLAIIHNCCRRVNSNCTICQQATNNIVAISNSKYLDLKATAFLSLAYIVDKSESHKLALNESCLEYLLGLLALTLQADGHRQNGYSTQEVVEGVGKLAVNDENKRLIVKKNGLDVFKSILFDDTCTEEEKQCAARGIWQVAFLDDNKQQIRENHKEIITGLEKLQNETSNTALNRAVSGALFVINDMKYGTKCDDDICEGNEAASSGDTSSGINGHIMISYQHDSQPLMLKVRDSLQRHGYKVWMDVDEMRGNILEGMARAVERASVVLVGMTSRYKESAPCRTEAEYAFVLKRNIVLLKLEEGFTPTDWLGALAGAKLYFSIFSDEQVNKVMPMLVRELGDRGKGDAPIVHVDFPDTGHLPTTYQGIETWDLERTQQWLETAGVNTENSSVKTVDGRILSQVSILLKRAPEFCAASLRDEFGLSFREILALVAALEKM